MMDVKIVKNGIDVSYSQGTIDWGKVKESGMVDYVILRAGYGRSASQKDETFERNYAECKRLGIPVGAYWFSYATDANDAKLEAKACAEVLAGKQFEYPVYYDLENDPSSNYYPLVKGVAHCTSLVQGFCDELERLGYFVGLYMSRSYLVSCISASVRYRYALWVAEYDGPCKYQDIYGMWQKASTGHVPGITANTVDIDECYVDYPASIKAAGKNGFPKTVATKKTIKVTIEQDGHTYSGTLTEQ